MTRGIVDDFDQLINSNTVTLNDLQVITLTDLGLWGLLTRESPDSEDYKLQVYLSREQVENLILRKHDRFSGFRAELKWAFSRKAFYSQEYYDRLVDSNFNDEVYNEMAKSEEAEE